jgi:hypothetical protein
MKTTVTAIVVALAGLIAWQRHRIVDLHETEQALMREATVAPASNLASASDPAASPESEPMARGLSEQELAQFTAEVLAHRQDFAGKRYYKLADVSRGNRIAVPSLCEPLRRLTAPQLLSILQAWSGGQPIARNGENGAGNFLMMVERVNPAALTQLYFDLKRESKESLVQGNPSYSLSHWFRQDPLGVSEWARISGSTAIADKSCAAWLNAAEVVRMPSVENMRRLFAEPTWEVENAASLVAQHLPSDESRLQFFQNLHTVSGGKVKDLGAYVHHLAESTSFAKLAHLADAVPSFATPSFQKSSPYTTEQPSGNLRYEVAVHSRDLTAEERWQWLVQRPADRPSGPLLTRLVKDWCDHSFTDTARWVKTLPPGPECDTARQAVAEFLKWNRAYELVAEWEPQPK